MYLTPRYGLVGVHGLADLDVRVRLVAKPLSAVVHKDRTRALACLADRRCGSTQGAARRREPPRLVEEVGLRTQAHRCLEHLAGVARVGDGPLRLIGLAAAVLPAHL